MHVVMIIYIHSFVTADIYLVLPPSQNEAIFKVGMDIKKVGEND